MYEEFPIYIFFNELFYFACRILWEKIDIYWWNIFSWLENVSLHHLLILILLLLLHQLLFIIWLWATVNLTKDKKEKKFYGFKIRLIVKVYTHNWEIRDYQLSRWQGIVAMCYSCFTSVLLERAEFRIFQDMHLLFLLLLNKIVFLASLWCSTTDTCRDITLADKQRDRRVSYPPFCPLPLLKFNERERETNSILTVSL